MILSAKEVFTLQVQSCHTGRPASNRKKEETFWEQIARRRRISSSLKDCVPNQRVTRSLGGSAIGCVEYSLASKRDKTEVFARISVTGSDWPISVNTFDEAHLGYLKQVSSACKQMARKRIE